MFDEIENFLVISWFEMLFGEVNLFLVCLLEVGMEAKSVEAISNCVELSVGYATCGLLGLGIGDVAVFVAVNNQSWNFDLFKVDLSFVGLDICNQPIHEAGVNWV